MSGNSFQFTPLREGRPPQAATPRHGRHFNSRPSARGDVQISFVVILPIFISIHAPPRGATQDARAPAGDDLFQFTPLREGRRNPRLRVGLQIRHFNSRPSARGDVALADAVDAVLYFNSRPSARGDARCMGTMCSINQHFNSRPSARGDFRLQRDYHGALISIHAPPRGATRQSAVNCFKLNFNSRPSARGDWTGC